MTTTSVVTCQHPDKVKYQGRQRAKHAARDHRAVFCRQCMSGCYLWRAYRCVEHWHCGHKRMVDS